ncbi:Putative disease resistance RPP13-like protein 1 [Glycine soja]|uniref:Putative disease resistance RPP13-like protein 1 n=1 Tax=Glycine soja TaxID=3848 RepID=A0A0B2QTR5_GLYSO|nr:Putative disease resistance RPP13-like protein 1 [Glycine soja]
MPVLETLGGALFGAVLQVLLDKLDSCHVLDYFRGRKLDEKLLYKLKATLRSIDAVVDDAEQKQYSYSRVREWLLEVKQAVLDAEDLLDEIDCKALKYKLEDDSQTTTSKVRNLLNVFSLSSIDKEIESRMKQLLDLLELLASQKSDLGLKNACDVGIGSGLGSNVLKILPQTSLVAEDVIYGRDDEKEMILNWLTSDIDSRSQLSIFSVVGMGGLGKTTLAQHVYNDPQIEAKFAIKAWVYVSDDFDVLKVIKAIIGAINKSKGDSGDLEILHKYLKDELTGKKFFLVLDDVWNEDRDQWKALKTPLKYGAQGSKILVTTRSNNVASTMQSNKVCQLKTLQEDHSWQVFAKNAFQDDSLQLNVELKEIGTKIVEKCKGLPLALETVGCLLRTKRSSVSEWEGVMISKIWDLRIEDSKILPALLLSYYHLPSHLKRCFAYCALFPKDHEFDKESLILLWMAENFLQCSQQNKSPKEVGEQYFYDLLSRSFFQQSNRDNKTCFVMHDFLNDLAKYVSGDICFRWGVDEEENIPKTTRHFSFVITDFQYFDGFDSLYYAQRLRTFMPISRTTSFIDKWDCKILTHEFFSMFKFLRVLSFSGCRDLEGVPDSIGNLIHLGSLDLSHTRIKTLPDSTCSLCNLQILKLNCCFFLEELPITLHKLTNLHRLELMGTHVTKVPMHLGKLKNLQVLMSPFIVGQSNELGIQQLGELNLHGDLSIQNLQNIVNPLDALAADLKNKTHLVGLDLEWDLNQIIDDSSKEREILENLQPSRHLEQLSISNYGGNEFPRWLSDKLLNVVSLNLKDCKYCGHLPPLGLLPCLKDLRISGLDWVVCIKAAFCGSSDSSFSSLETLEFSDMKEWEEWELMTGAFPRLQRLSIQHCPKLKGHLPKQLCHLKELLVQDCKQLVTFAPKAIEICELDLEDCGKLHIDYHPTTLKRLQIRGYNMEASLLERIEHIIADTSLESLRISYCPNMNIPMNHCYDFLVRLEIYGGFDSLMTLPLDFIPKLCELVVSRCRNLRMISQMHPHKHLKSLSIHKCPQFESFPNEGLSAPRLDWFAIEGLNNLKSLPERMSILLPSLTSLCIRDCPRVEFSDGCLPSSLKHLDLLYCPKLVVSLKGALGANPSLERLHILKVDKESFPDIDLLPLSLTYLRILLSPDLRKLDYKGLCQLSSLEKLILYDCPSLQCLPEEGLPKSISTFKIQNCPLLKQRCKESEGNLENSEGSEVRNFWHPFGAGHCVVGSWGGFIHSLVG